MFQFAKLLELIPLSSSVNCRIVQYRPQRSWGKVIFSEACVHILSTGGRGCSGGACVVALRGGMRGCLGDMCGCSGGACVVAWGGMHG